MKDRITIMTEGFVRTLGETAYKDMRKHCPVRTGRLKRSLTLRNRTDRLTSVPYATISTDVPYAFRVEFGAYNYRPRYFMNRSLNPAYEQAPLLLSLLLREVRI